MTTPFPSRTLRPPDPRFSCWTGHAKRPWMVAGFALSDAAWGRSTDQALGKAKLKRGHRPPPREVPASS